MLQLTVIVQVRAVCDYCTKRTLVFEMPQLYCVRCKIVLRLPGNMYYQESDDSATAGGGGKGIQLCTQCFCELREHRGQAGPNPLFKTIGRTEELEIAAFTEIKVPKSGQPERYGRCLFILDVTMAEQWLSPSFLQG